MKLYKKILFAAATVFVLASMFAEEKISVQQPPKTQDAVNASHPDSILPPHAG